MLKITRPADRQVLRRAVECDACRAAADARDGGEQAELAQVPHLMLCYVMLWCPFNTPASAVGVGGGGFHGIRSVGGGAQPLDHT
jgi:hypothetical protein